MRVFFAINIYDDLKSDLFNFVKNSKIIGNIIPKNNYHITLKFIGEIDNTQLKNLINDIKTIDFKIFECSIKGFGIFGKMPNPSLLFANIDKGIGEIKSLNELIHKKSNEYRLDFDFCPHITLIRNPIMKDLSKYEFISQPFIVNNFCLMKSFNTNDGIKYEIIRCFKLK